MKSTYEHNKSTHLILELVEALRGPKLGPLGPLQLLAAFKGADI